MNTNNRLGYIILSLMLFYALQVSAQSLEAPIMGNACITATIDRSDSATFSPPDDLPLSTEYSLQLSNEFGSFLSGTTILDRKTPLTNGMVEFSFDYPLNDSIIPFGSDLYRVRVIIENQNDILPGQARGPISIFVYSGETLDLEPRQICSLQGNPELRAEDDLSEYRWYRNEVLIQGETERTLRVTSPGDYHYRPFLGNCDIVNISGARSNTTVVAETLGNIDVEISSSASTTICASDSIILQIDNPNPNFRYQWVKNNNEILGETNESITITGLNSEGNYNLEVLDVSDTVTRCTSISNNILVTLLNPSIEIISDLNLVSIPGIQNILQVEVSGGTPRSITWIKDGVDIPNSNTENFIATDTGVYTARLTAESPCSINTVVTSKSINVVNADNLNLVIDYDNPAYTNCGLSRVNLNITEISTTVNNTIIEVPMSNFRNTNFTWFNNNEELPQFTGPTVVVEDAGGNGNYFAEITLGAAIFTSNILPVQLNPGELSIEASTTILDENNPTSNLSVPLTDEAIASLYTYRWFREDFNASNGQTQISTSSSVEVNEAGNYFVEVTFDNCPVVRLNTVFISEASVVIPNILTPNGSNNTRWQLPAQFTGQPNVNVQIISSTGVEVLNQNNYNGTWPDDELLESVYYYIISENNNPLEKGSITIIR